MEWHLRERLAPLLLVDEDNAERAHWPVQRSATAKRKNGTLSTLEGGQPLRSFEDLLRHLVGLTLAELRLEVPSRAFPTSLD